MKLIELPNGSFVDPAMKRSPEQTAFLAKVAEQVKAACASAPMMPPPQPEPPPTRQRIPAGHTHHPTDPTACVDPHGFVKRRHPSETRPTVWRYQVTAHSVQGAFVEKSEGVALVRAEGERIFISGKWQGHNRYTITTTPTNTKKS